MRCITIISIGLLFCCHSKGVLYDQVLQYKLYEHMHEPYRLIHILWPLPVSQLNDAVIMLVSSYTDLIEKKGHQESWLPWFIILDMFFQQLYVASDNQELFFIAHHVVPPGYLKLTDHWQTIRFIGYKLFSEHYFDILAMHFIKHLHNAWRYKCMKLSAHDSIQAMELYNTLQNMFQRLIDTEHEQLYALQLTRYQELIQLLHYERRR